jgi:hypothetical protein
MLDRCSEGAILIEIMNGNQNMRIYPVKTKK